MNNRFKWLVFWKFKTKKVWEMIQINQKYWSIEEKRQLVFISHKLQLAYPLGGPHVVTDSGLSGVLSESTTGLVGVLIQIKRELKS